MPRPRLRSDLTAREYRQELAQGAGAGVLPSALLAIGGHVAAAAGIWLLIAGSLAAVATAARHKTVRARQR